jgi:glycine betaine/proline transport system ATP-binding protein
VLPQPLPSAEIDAVLDGTPADAGVTASGIEGVR